ncbi:MAG: type II secretion system protein [Gammaproteobacteria bacterium]
MNQNLFISRLQKGFTLVELLIVVIILSILAAIALPQFSAGTNDAKLAALDTTLGNMRSVIDLYAQQHNGVYPGAVISTGASCNTGNPDATGGTVNTAPPMLAQLTLYTNAAGQACTGPGANFPFGPYLKKADLPKNPWTDSRAINISSDGILGMTGLADPFSVSPAAAWKYNTGSGQFIADDNRFIPPGGAVATDPTFDQL